MVSPHGIPVDLLDRLLIIKTTTYGLEELMKILAIRASTENIKLTPEALAYLGEVGDRTSLRYCVQLLSPAWVLANTKGKSEISKEEIVDVNELFYDAKESAKLLMQQRGAMELVTDKALSFMSKLGDGSNEGSRAMVADITRV